MGVGGGGRSAAPAAAAGAAASAPKPVPPPAQMSASLQAVRGQKNAAAAIGDMGGTILTSGGGVELTNPVDQRSAASVLYGKKLTGA